MTDPRLKMSGGGAHGAFFSNDATDPSRVEIAPVKIAEFRTDFARPLHVEVACVYQADQLYGLLGNSAQKLRVRVVETKNADVFAEKVLQLPAVGLAWNTVAQQVAIFVETINVNPAIAWKLRVASSIAVGSVNRDKLSSSWWVEDGSVLDALEIPHYAATARIESLLGLATYRWLNWSGAVITELPVFAPAPAFGQIFNVPAEARFLQCTRVGADKLGTVVWGFQ